MNTESARICEAVVYGYQAAENNYIIKIRKIEKNNRLDMADLRAKLDEVTAERDNLARMNDELTTNEWGRIRAVLEAVSIKLNYSGADLKELDKALQEVRERPYKAHVSTDSFGSDQLHPAVTEADKKAVANFTADIINQANKV